MPTKVFFRDVKEGEKFWDPVVRLQYTKVSLRKEGTRVINAHSGRGDDFKNYFYAEDVVESLTNKPVSYQKGQRVVYKPTAFSRNENQVVEITSVNKHGHITILFLDGPCKGQKRGVKERDLGDLV